MNEDWERFCWLVVSFALGFLVAEFRNWLARRRGLFSAIVDRYVMEVRGRDVAKTRLLALRHAGIAGIAGRRSWGWWGFDCFARRVVERGCAYPCEGTVIEGLFSGEAVPHFIDEASRAGVDLGDELAVLAYLNDLVAQLPPFEMSDDEEEENEPEE